MDLLSIMSWYLLFGAAWIGLCVLARAFQVEAEKPLLALLFMVAVWPLILYRLVRNIIKGDRDGRIF